MQSEGKACIPRSVDEEGWIGLEGTVGGIVGGR
jgi:hypothetical protein